MRICIAIVEDDNVLRESLTEVLEKNKYIVLGFSTGTLLKKHLRQRSELQPDLVLLDVCLPDVNGMALLEHIQKQNLNLSIMIMTGFGDVNQSVEAIKKGASDYLLKPFNVDELLLKIKRILKEKDLTQTVEALEGHVCSLQETKCILGPNKTMQKLYDQLDLIASSPSSTVHIHGETGTGKEVIARRLHILSPRRFKPFVEINATSLSSELLESELFGHEEGAFTGASKTKKGLFELADKGTFFLDEIGDMPLALQSKLLKAIEEREIRRVGSLESIPIDVRLITATHQNLEQLVKEKTFREDLMYRLNVIPLQLPPLRKRIEDLEALTMHFIQDFNLQFGKCVQEVSKGAFELLQGYEWPGNIRELKNIIERTMLLYAKGDVLTPQQLLQAHPRLSSNSTLQQQREQIILKTQVSLEEMERQHIKGILDETNGNKHKAAQILGIDRTTLYNKLKKYDKQLAEKR